MGEVLRYPAVVRAVRAASWAIVPEKLEAILEMVALRARGGCFSAEEIEARIGPQRAADARERVGTVAVLPLYGVITPKVNMMSDISGGTSAQQYAVMFQSAVDNPEVGAILLDIDSPGGSTDLIPELAAQIREARGSKPIVAIANTDAASAAYWVGAQADELVITPSGMVGSIGVFAAHDDLSAQLEQDGVKTTLISAGKYKVESSPYEPLSDDARAAIQERVDEFYGQFVADVAAGRGVALSAVTGGFGEGRLVTAKTAVKNGMADRVATFEATVEDLIGRAMAGGSGGRAIARARASGAPPGLVAEAPPDAADPIQHDIEATPIGGLSFVGSAYAVRDAADKLVNDARSLNGAKRSRLITAAKRDGLQAAADALTASAQAIGVFLAEADPEPEDTSAGSDVLLRALMRDAERRHFSTNGAVRP